MALPRISLVHAPTPIVRIARLDAMLGVNLFIKRDDVTGGAEAGNKVRKLEYLLAGALACGANTVITCGGIQSNHARATALSCAALGLSCVLLLRVAPGEELAGQGGNVLLDRLAGAEVRLISREDYARRGEVMAAVADELREAGRAPYVIPEGGSNGLGSIGYVEAMREVKEQLALGLGGGPAPYELVVHACGSGGTAAGIALGCALHGTAREVRAMAVCDDAEYFRRATDRIAEEARAIDPSLPSEMPLTIDDAAKGPGYAVMSAEQRRFVVTVARVSGVVLDPVYTGKALFGLSLAIERGDVRRGSRVLFVHTGGLPGLLAQAGAFDDELA